MHKAISRQRPRPFCRIVLATIALALCAQAHAGDTRRCQINGRTIITNLSCEQLAKEAGITLPERDKSQPSKPAPEVAPALKPMLDKALAREDEELPYHQAPVMSRYELEMFERLKTALPECETFPQVPLAYFIRIDKNRACSRYATNSYRWQNCIGQQRVDFLA